MNIPEILKLKEEILNRPRTESNSINVKVDELNTLFEVLFMCKENETKMKEVIMYMNKLKNK